MAELAEVLSSEVVVLASASQTRCAMLERAGIAVEPVPAGVDEDEVKRSMRAEGAGAADVAVALAELKSMSVSRRRPGRLVVGADQVLECDGAMFDKPAGRDAAAGQLGRLSGRAHALISAASACRDGQILWRHVDRAELVMRELSDDFIGHYLDWAGDSILDGPGAYRVEGLGSHLFVRITGDHFTVLGLPLLPLLDFLRQNAIVPA